MMRRYRIVFCQSGREYPLSNSCVILSSRCYSPHTTIKWFPLRSEFLITKLSAVMNEVHVSSQRVNQPGNQRGKNQGGLTVAARSRSKKLKVSYDAKFMFLMFSNSNVCL